MHEVAEATSSLLKQKMFGNDGQVAKANQLKTEASRLHHTIEDAREHLSGKYAAARRDKRLFQKQHGEADARAAELQERLVELQKVADKVASLSSRH
jgi:hypothetical protein